MTDDEYSPEHQDEYRRLWHRDAAEVARLRDGLREIGREALRFNPDTDHIAKMVRALLAEDGAA